MLKEKEEGLKNREIKLNSLVARVEKDGESAKEKVKLNVGGTYFITTKETLCKYPDTYFSAMLQNGNWKPSQDDGAYFIDRDPTYFSRILSALRTGRLNMIGVHDSDLTLLEEELDFYLLYDIFIPIPFNFSSERIGIGLKVDERKRTLTAIKNKAIYRVGISEQVFTSVNQLPDSFSLKILNTGRTGIHGDNRYMKVEYCLLPLCLSNIFCC